MNKNARLGLLILAVAILITFVLLNVFGVFGNLFGGQALDRKSELQIDFVTLQSTIKAVQTPDIPKVTFVEAVDTLSQSEDLTKLRNPFRRVIKNVVIPKKSTPTIKRPTAAPKKKTTPRKKRIVRPKISVNGIIWDRSRPYAILDGEIYGEGDFIKGYTIQTIVDSLIVLYNDNDIYTLNYIME